MRVSITKRQLRDREIDALIREMRQFPDVGLMNRRLWLWYPQTYIVMHRNVFAGVCAVYPLNHWLKIGPIIVLSKHQNQGLGSMVFRYVVQHNRGHNLYIGSLNMKVWHMASALGFHKETSFWRIPFEIQKYLLRYFVIRLSFDFIVDAVNKRIHSPHRFYYYFLKPAE